MIALLSGRAFRRFSASLIAILSSHFVAKNLSIVLRIGSGSGALFAMRSSSIITPVSLSQSYWRLMISQSISFMVMLQSPSTSSTRPLSPFTNFFLFGHLTSLSIGM